MINGQVIDVSMQSIAPFATLESSAPAAAMAGGEAQQAGDFAGLLSGLQLLAQTKASPGLNLAEQLEIEISGNKLFVNSAVAEPVVDLLATFSVSPLVTTATEKTLSVPDVPEEVSDCNNAAPLASELSDVASQMALAAYLHSGRMLEVNMPTPLPANTLQNVASITERPVVTMIPSATVQPELNTAEAAQTAPQKQATAVAEKPTVVTEKLTAEPAVAGTTERPAVTAASLATKQPELNAAEAAPAVPPATPTPQQQTVATVAVAEKPKTEATEAVVVERSPITAAPTSIKQSELHAAEAAPAVPLATPQQQTVATVAVAEKPKAEPTVTVVTERSPITPAPAAIKQPELHTAETAPAVPPATLQKQTVAAVAVAEKPNAEATVAVVAGRPPITPAPTTIKQPELKTVEAAPVPAQKQTAAATVRQAAEPVTEVAAEQTAITAAPIAIEQPEQNIVEAVLAAPQKQTVTVAEKPAAEPVVAQKMQPTKSEEISEIKREMPAVVPVATSAASSEAMDRDGNVKKPAPNSLDSLQKVTSALEPPADRPVPVTAKVPEQNTAEPIQTMLQKPAVSPAERPPVVRQEYLQSEPSAAILETRQATPVAAQTEAGVIKAETAFRVEEVNKPTAPSVGTAQNVAVTIEQPVATTAPVATRQPGQNVAAESAPATPALLKPTVAVAEKPVAVTPVEQKQHSETARTEAVRVQSELAAPLESSPATPAEVQESAPAPVAKTEAQYKTVDVNKPTPPAFDKLQNVAITSEQTAPVTASAEPLRNVQQAPTEIPVVNLTVEQKPLQPESVRTGRVVDVHKPATASQPLVSSPASSPELALEIQLSQPRPITAPVSTDTRSSALRMEISNGGKRLTVEQFAAPTTAGTTQDDVKEMAQPLQVTAVAKTMTDSDASRGGENNKSQADDASENQALAQNMRGALFAETQKNSPVTIKVVITEPVRQDVSAQIVPQIKERLLRHEVKPGNQQITLILSPDSLGELKMNLNLQGQKLTVEIITENRAVRDVIAQHTDALKESLARQNITMESFDVTTGGKGSGGQGQNQNAWRELAKQQQFLTSPRGYTTTARAEIPTGQVAYQQQSGQSTLDIHY